MSQRLSPFADLLPRAANAGIIDAWHIQEAYFVLHRGPQTYYVGTDELIDVLFDLTEEQLRVTAAGEAPHLDRPAA